MRSIEYVPLSALIPADLNAKLHNIDGIAASITQFGHVEPQLVDDRTGKLIAGHGRAEALIELSLAGAPPPVGVEVDEAGVWLVPIVRGWSSSSDAEAHAIGVALNQHTMSTGFDPVILDQLLREAADLVTPDVLGFSDEALAALMKEIEPVAPPTEFRSYDENIDTQYRCPSCGYEWSGQPAPGQPTHTPPTADPSLVDL